MSHTAAPKVAFIFDCDGTLVNSTPVWGYAQPELLRRHGIDVTVDDFAQFEHLSLEDECQAYHDTWGIGANGEELYRELREILIDGYSKVPPREGDPTAGSPTVTLLRLHPSHESQSGKRPPEG